MTLDIQAILERCEKATPGEWINAVGCVYVGRPGRMIVDAQACENLDANTEFIAHARTDIPMLIDELHAETEKSFWQAKEIERLRGAIREFLTHATIAQDSNGWYEITVHSDEFGNLQQALAGDSHDN